MTVSSKLSNKSNYESSSYLLSKEKRNGYDPYQYYKNSSTTLSFYNVTLNETFNNNYLDL